MTSSQPFEHTIASKISRYCSQFDFPEYRGTGVDVNLACLRVRRSTAGVCFLVISNVTNWGWVNVGCIPTRPASVDQVHTKNNKHTSGHIKYPEIHVTTPSTCSAHVLHLKRGKASWLPTSSPQQLPPRHITGRALGPALHMYIYMCRSCLFHIPCISHWVNCVHQTRIKNYEKHICVYI